MTKQECIEKMLIHTELLESEPMKMFITYLTHYENELPAELFCVAEEALADLKRVSDEIYEVARDLGKEEALEQCEEDYDSGYKEGRANGYDEGYEEGYEMAKGDYSE